MKIIKKVFFAFFIMLINVYSAFAQGGGPNQPGGGTPPPPGVPIDNHLLILVAAALIVGIAVIYKNKIKKASV